MHNLPTQPTQLLGRDGEVAAAQKLLQQPPVRLLSLLGHGGVGKTRLAIAIAESVARTFPGGVFFVDLVPLTEPDQVVAQVASTIGLRDAGDRSILARLKSALSDREMLLVLDNFEHVVPAAPQLSELLCDCPQLKLLVTSRVPLHVQWERQFPVTPLALPDLQRLPTWTKLTEYASVRLFIERAQMVQPDFQLTERNAATIAASCAALDGLPLAIELAAARVKPLSLTAIWDWLNHASARGPLQLLATSYPDLPTRHLSLRAAIDWSYRLLTEDEQALFRQLAVFAGDFSLDAAESLIESQVWGMGAAEGARQLQIFDGIASLVDKNLLTRRSEADDREDGEARYQMLQTIREFGLEQLIQTGEQHEAQRRHALLFTSLAESADREQNSPKETLWFNRLAREWDNLRAALRWLLENDPETGLRLAGSLDRFWEARDEQGEGRQWLEALLARADTAHMQPQTLAKALSAAGTMAWRHCDYRQALDWHQQSLDLYRSCGDQHGHALALNNLGVQQNNLGNVQAASECYEACIALARESSDLQAETFALVNLGILAIDLHDLQRARGVIEQGLACARRLGSERTLVAALSNLGEVLLGLGETQAARDLLRECIQRSYACELKTELAYSLEQLAGAYRAQGMLRKAAQLFGAADALREALKVPPHPSYREVYYDPMRQAMQDGLGAEAFDTAWTAGRAAPLADMIAEALADDEASAAASDSASGPSASPLPAAATHALSRRECEVATLIARGLSNREIADALVITEGTAANHVAHIMNKLDCRSRAQVAAWAVTCGLLSVPDPS